MYMYIRYENKKAWMAANKDHQKPIERWLWHGTKKHFVDGIIRNGFTKIKMGENGNMFYISIVPLKFSTPITRFDKILKSHCHVLAVAYGDGSYFAMYANYSHQHRYATPEEGTGERHMFYCRCLTGDYTASSGFRGKMPPDKEQEDGTDKMVPYDTTVDRESAPIMFIIYNPDQIYPQYLIKYKDGNSW